MNKKLESFIPSLLSILIGLIAASIILMVIGINPIVGFSDLIQTVFSPGNSGNYQYLADIVNSAIPLILCGFAIAFAYKVGLFNIGAEGQFMIATLVAMVCAQIDFPSAISFLHPLFCILAGGIAGALWALVPGMLKAYLKINEVVVGILMNLIAIKGMTEIVSSWFNSSDKGATFVPQIKETADIHIFGTDFTFAIIIVLLASVVFWFIFKKTKLGFELKAVGYNPEGSSYAGINQVHKIITSMLISGFFAGLAGAIYALEMKSFSITGAGFEYGFNGIVVAMVGAMSPIGTIISGLFIAFLQIGLPLIDTAVKPQISQMIIAVIFTCSAIGMVYPIIKNKYLSKRGKHE